MDDFPYSFKNLTGFEKAIIAITENAMVTGNNNKLVNPKLFCRQCKKILIPETSDNYVEFGCKHFFWGFSK